MHAVQRPAEAPAISSLTATRAPGQTSALLAGQIRVHGASSERVDLVAEWDEAPAAGPPEAAPRHAHVLECPVHVGYDLPPGVTAPRDAIRYDEGAGEIILTAPASPASGGRIQPTPAPRHEFGDTRHRKVRYRAVATSRFREYLPETLTADPANLTQPSEPLTVDVPSSARPQAPQVVQVLPTFAWRRDDPAGPGIVNTRRGGGLRVYLQPPWFTSGEGELLGMVLWPSGIFSPDQPFLTRCGRDPIWPQDDLPVPTLQEAIDPVATTSSVRLADYGSPIVAVAGYPLTWDADRELWSCDVGLRMPDAYTPFVRLALVRWQPGSLPGLELSPLVLAELTQPAPDRALMISRIAADTASDLDPGNPFPPQPLVVRLQLDGPGPPTRVDLTVQRRLPGTAAEVGWVDITGEGIDVAHTTPPAGSSARWAGQVSFPDANADRFRIIVRESEIFPDSRLRVLFVETLEI